MGNNDVISKCASDCEHSRLDVTLVTNAEDVKLPAATCIEMIALNQRLKTREGFPNKFLSLVIVILSGIIVFLLARMNNDEIERRIKENELVNFEKYEENIRRMMIETINETEIERSRIDENFRKTIFEVINERNENMNQENAAHSSKFMDDIKKLMMKTLNETEIQNSKSLENNENFQKMIAKVLDERKITQEEENTKLREDFRKMIVEMMDERDQRSNEENEMDYSKLKEDIQQMITSKIETIDRNLKNREARRKLEKIKCLNEFPKKLMDKWIPDLSRFQGVRHYLRQTGQDRDALDEELFYQGRPIFEMDQETNNMRFHLTTELYKTYKILMSGDCEYTSDSYGMRVFLKDGDLYILRNLYFDNSNATSVYYIPDHDLEHAFI